MKATTARTAALGVLVSLSQLPAQAQQDELELVVVTGSRIARDEFSSPAPISVYSNQDFLNSGVVTIDEFLREAPAFTGFTYGVSTNNGNIGLKAVDVRGLDTKRTLVLINGRRQVGSFIGGNGDVGAVDLNTIPHSLIERVEVLKDGASTIYGSDALGGVVNVILKDDYEGAEFQVTYGAGTGNSAENYGFSGLVGTSSNRGSVLLSVDYSKQEEMFQRERDWAIYDLHALLDPATDTFVATPSGSSNSRRIRSSEFDTASADLLEAAGLGRSEQFIVDESSGLVRPFEAGDVYNYAPVNALITPNERYQISGIGRYEITSNVTAFVEGTYTRRFSHQRLAADASFAVDPAFNGHWNDLVPASNPSNPFGDFPNNTYGISGQDVRINRRFEESGGRLFSQAVNTYRIVFGLEGDISDRISWELAYNWAENEDTETTNFYHRFDRWETIVDPALCGADAACIEATGGVGYMDPFGPFGTITPGEINYLMASSLKDVRRNDLQSASLIFNGELGASLGGGNIGWAAGIEHRRESASYVPDEFVAGGLTTGGAGDPLEGHFGVDEVYGEVILPFTDRLELDLSARDTSYDTSAGDSTNYRAGVLFQATDTFAIRSTYSTGFRAPNIVELYGGAQTDFPIVEDPCEFYNRRVGISPNVAANCLADGIDPDFEWGFQWQSAYTIEPPASLQPEESKTLSIGGVWESASLEGFSLSADIWDIQIDGLINEIPYNDLLLNCLSAADRSTEPACAFFVTGLGHADGVPEDATVQLANLGTVKTNGVDLNLTYMRPTQWRWAQNMVFNVEATYVDSYTQEFPVTGIRERVGTIRYSEVFPEWRINTLLTFQGRDWSATWGSRYISSMTDYLRPANLTDDAVAESIWYHDLYANLDFWDNFSIVIGLDNITDEDPPRFHSAFNAETEPGYYDVIGRRFFTTLSVRF